MKPSYRNSFIKQNDDYYFKTGKILSPEQLIHKKHVNIREKFSGLRS